MNIEGVEVLLIFMLVVAVTAACAGLHCIDNAYNMERLGVAKDCLPTGDCKTSVELYNLGTMATFAGIFAITMITGLMCYYAGANKREARL